MHAQYRDPGVDDFRPVVAGDVGDRSAAFDQPSNSIHSCNKMYPLKSPQQLDTAPSEDYD